MLFVELEHHAVWLVLTKREKIMRFIDDLNYGLHYKLNREVGIDARVDQVVEIAR